MSNEKIEEALRVQAELLGRLTEARKFPDHKDKPSQIESLKHCAWMIPQAIEFLQTGRREKAMRWLCFVQGVMWDRGFWNIGQLKDHNRPPGEPFQEDG